MKMIADQKRRVVLPRPAKPGDVFECIESGDRIVLIRLAPPTAIKPPVAIKRLEPGVIDESQIDEPAFPPLSDESAA